MKLILLALALLMAFVAVAMAQAASPAVAVSGEMPGPVPTKADVEQLVGVRTTPPITNTSEHIYILDNFYRI
jgi:hypothetical protein